MTMREIMDEMQQVMADSLMPLDIFQDTVTCYVCATSASPHPAPDGDIALAMHGLACMKRVASLARRFLSDSPTRDDKHKMAVEVFRQCLAIVEGRETLWPAQLGKSENFLEINLILFFGRR